MTTSGDCVYLQSLAYQLVQRQVGSLTEEEVKKLLDAIGNVSMGRNLDYEAKVLETWREVQQQINAYVQSGKVSTFTWDSENRKT